MILLVLSHVSQDQVPFIWFAAAFAGLLGCPFVLQVDQVLRRKDVYVAADVFLFEGFDEESPEIFEGQIEACFGCGFHDGLWSEGAFPQSKAQFLLDGDS